jgi:hypothetical protein
LAGAMLPASFLASPPILCRTLMILYDLALLISFCSHANADATP